MDNKQNGATPNLPPGVEVMARIEILYLNNGTVACTGNIDNKMVSFGMLALAKEAIRDHIKAQENPSRIVQAPAGLRIAP